jgi:uroporphyrinogen decarboxylase
MAGYLQARGIDWDRLKCITGDKVSVGADYTGPLADDPNLYTAIWGIRRRDISYEGGKYEEFTDFPLAGFEDPGALESYPWPVADSFDYSRLRECALETVESQKRALQLWTGNPFEIYSWMTGLEESLINVIANPDLVRAALNFIVDFFEERLRRELAEIGDLVDIVFLADDLGGQGGLLMSREAYRDLLQPVHARLTAAVRELAPHAFTMFHTDGAVFEVIPDLIDAGVMILEAVQTNASGMEPQRLKDTYGDRICFHGAIGVQDLLPHHDESTVYDECRRRVDTLGENGGYIAAPSHAIQVGTPPENVLAMLRAVLGEGDYEEAMDRAAL